MSQEINPSVAFLTHFTSLRNASNDNIQSLITFFRDKDDLSELAEQVKETADQIDLILTYRKVHSQVSPVFIEAWKLYNRVWRVAVDYVVSEKLWQSLPSKLLRPYKPTPFEEFAKYHGYPNRKLAPDEDIDWRFDPERHDGGEAIRQFHELADHMAQIGFPYDEDESEKTTNAFHVGIEAFEFLEETIGFDTSAIFARWAKVPSLFVPRHVSNKYGFTEKGSLFALLSDAIRSYVAGAPAASIAMCRAALEMVLRDHYLRGQVTKRDKLAPVIELAALKYDFLSKTKMNRLARDANRIMHDYAGVQRLTDEDEERLLSHLRDLKFYIEKAPE
jgi:hypothetical protein